MKKEINTRTLLTLFLVLICVTRAFANISEADSMGTDHTISDGAQMHTLAFSGLTYITGSLGANSFLPPGKMADYFGFQHLRDNDPDDMGHNTSFVPIIANNLLQTLSVEQRDSLIELAYEQVDMIENYALSRFPLLDAFQRLLDDDIPDGATGLIRDSVMAYSAKIFAIDGEIAYRRAQVFGNIIRSMDETQINHLDSLSGMGALSYPDIDDVIPRESMPHEVHVAVMTYASALFSWFNGTTDSDVYFCPERVATYFGSFYVKDIPAMLSDTAYSIPMNLTDSLGRAFMNVISPDDSALIASLVDSQRIDLYSIVAIRDSISRSLRGFIESSVIDSSRLMDLVMHYGELDGSISYLYANTFSGIKSRLTGTQLDSLFYYRNLEPYSPDSAFLYSDRILMPEIIDTDFFFGISTHGLAAQSIAKPESVNIKAFPNPFNSQISISTSEDFTISIYDLYGKLIRSDKSTGGSYNWQPGSDVDSGVYMARIYNEGIEKALKLIYVK